MFLHLKTHENLYIEVIEDEKSIGDHGNDSRYYNLENEETQEKFIFEVKNRGSSRVFWVDHP